MKDIYSEVLDLDNTYKKTTIDIVEGLPFSQYDTLRTIEFYSNSKYTNGSTDELNREKPFHNIVNANVDIAIVATDLDTKDIQISSKDNGMRGFVKSFLLKKELELWMREENFAKTLNEIGETRARYGGVLVKRVKEDGKLKIEVVQWKNVATDPSDILNNPIIETHYLTVGQLQAKSDVWQNVDKALKLFKKGERKLKVLEVHGMFQESYIDPNASDDTYSQQVHIIASAGSKNAVLFSGLEKELPYKYLPWKTVSGRALGRGVVEEGIEAQVWTNDSVMAEREIMNLAGKLVLQTSSKKYSGRNVLNELVTGTILEHEDNRPITQVDLSPRTIPVFQSLVERWQRQYDRSSAITDALRGETPPSGQAFRLQALVTQQSASSFDYRREELGIFIKDLFYSKGWIIDYLSAQLKKAHIMETDFDLEQLTFIDEAYINYLTEKELIKAKKEGTPLDPFQVQQEMMNAREKIQKTKNRRPLEIPEGYLDGKYSIDIVTTGEQVNKAATLESLSSILTLVSQNPMILQDPVLKDIMSRILEVSGIGISPAELMSRQPMMQPAPVSAPQAEQPSTLPEPSDIGAGRVSANA